MLEQKMRANIEIFINLVSFFGSFFVKVVWLSCPDGILVGDPHV